MNMKKSKDVLSRSFLRQYGNMILMAPFGVITMVVDSFFIGRSFGELSGAYLSSVGLIAPVNMLFFLVADVLSAGIRGPVSREIGKGDKKQANAILRAGTLAGLTASKS